MNFNNIDWDKLRVFYHVTVCKSFTSAALKLNLSQSALSRSIQGLEDRIGASLFHRHARGITLTEKGQILFQAAEKIRESIQIANMNIAEVEKTPKGSLKIQASAGVVSRLFIKNAREFCELYPEVNLKIVTGDAVPVFGLNEAEVAIYPYMENQETLIQDPLLSFHLGLYASPHYLKTFGTPQKKEDLENHRLIAYGDHQHPFPDMNWHLNLGCPEGKVHTPFIQANLGYMLLRLAEQDTGIVTLAQESSNFINPDDKLVRVLPDIQGPEIKFFYIYPRQLQDSLRIKVFGEFIKKIAKREKLV